MKAMMFAFLANMRQSATNAIPAWPYLPQDILGHEHMSKDILEDSAVQDALSRYAEGEEL